MQAEDGIRSQARCRGLEDVYKGQLAGRPSTEVSASTEKGNTKTKIAMPKICFMISVLYSFVCRTNKQPLFSHKNQINTISEYTRSC